MNIFIRHKFFVLNFTIFFFLSSSLLSAQGHNQDQTKYVEGTIRGYYNALKNHDCQTAIKFRPSRTKSDCNKVEYIDEYETKILKQYPNSAVVHLYVKLKKIGVPQKIIFEGFAPVRKTAEGLWIIPQSPPFKSNKDTKIDEYIGQYRNQLLQPVTSLKISQKIQRGNSDIIAPKKEKSWRSNPISKFLGFDKTASLSEFGDAKVLAACFPKNYRKNTNFKNCIDKGFCFSRPIARERGEEKINRRYERHLRWREQPARKTFTRMSPLPKSKRRSIRSVNVHGQKLVALTFDLCEQNNEFAGYDGRIIDFLRKHKIKSTFYAGGKWMATHEQRAMQLIADPLFEMGNHGWTHGNLRYLRGREMREQITWTQAQYEILREKLESKACYKKILKDHKPKLQQTLLTLRYPYGTCSKEALDTAAQLGLPSIQWDVVTADPWRGQTKAGILSAIRKVKPGSIVIMHANGRGWKTSQAIPEAIRNLRARGYQFVTVSELMRAGQPIAKNTCYEVRPGDNIRYDRIFRDGRTAKSHKKKRH